MIKSKLCQMLQTFTREEWKDFARFVASPYFNTHEKCKKLLAYLKEQFWQKKWDALDKIEIKKVLFEGEIYTETYFRVVVSQLTQLAEKYFIQQELERQSLYQEHFLRHRLIEKGLFKQYEQHRKSSLQSYAKLEQKQELKKGIDYYLAKYLSSIDYFKYLQLKKARNISIDVVTDTINDLDEFFLIKRLRLMNSSLSVQRNLQIKEEIAFFNEIIQMVSAKTFVDNSLMQSYFSTLQLFLHPDEEHWANKIQEQIEHQLATIPQQELNEFYTIITNYYIRKTNAGKNYYAKVLELYKLMDRYDFLCLEQYITADKFKNIVTLGCHFREFDWTKKFIKKYKLKLLPDNRESIYHFNMGALYFYQKQFEKAQSHLTEVAPFNIYYTTDVRSLLLRIYFETQQFFAVHQSCSSFKDFIRKQKKFPKNYKQSYLHFIGILEKLTKSKQKYSDINKYKKQLVTKVDKYPSIFHKQWLLEKIDGL